MSRVARTDFEEYGLSRGPLPVSGRFLLLTVDFEAFAPEMLPLWLDAMLYWAACAKRSRLRFCFFLSVEDVLRIRATGRGAYHQLLAAMRALDDAGSLFYAHNHFVFDPETGRKQPVAQEPVASMTGYGKRRSVFFDVCHRHRLGWATWMTTVRQVFDRTLEDARCRPPTFSVFRAGGWDYGESRDDLSRYLEGLAAAGFHADSSACRGRFGTPGWRIGADYGRNVFRLEKQLVEIAPTWSVDIGGRPVSPAWFWNILSLGRQSRLWVGQHGVFVVVLHFDHLFNGCSSGRMDGFRDTDIPMVRVRVRRVFRLLTVLQSVFRFENGTFETVQGTAA